MPYARELYAWCQIVPHVTEKGYTYYLAKNYGKLKIEILAIKSFLNNHKLAGAIGDCEMYEFPRQIEYKIDKFLSQLTLIDWGFPSSQNLLWQLGKYRHKRFLTNRVYVCPDCGQKADRDLNAAKNIEGWFEGIFIRGRSDKMASYAKIASEVDKHLERQLKTALKQEVSGKSIELSLFDLLT